MSPTRSARGEEFQDCYSDVYALGVLIAQMCKFANTFVARPIQDLLQADKNANPSGRRIFSSYYSVRLKELIRKCRSRIPLERPSSYELYVETKNWMEAFRDHAYREEQESGARVVAGVVIHHNKVLYTKEEVKLFEQNTEFRSAYTAVNVDPVFEAEDLDTRGSERVKRRYKKLLETIDESIITVIPQSPDYEIPSRGSSPNSGPVRAPSSTQETGMGTPRRAPKPVMIAPARTKPLHTSVPLLPGAVPLGSVRSSKLPSDASPIRPPSLLLRRSERIRGKMNVANILNSKAEEW